MDAATAYYRARGWYVERVSDIKKVLDLRLVHPVSGEQRRVEVKGSSQAASHVEVTRAEVARSREEACELFVLDKILYHETGPGPNDYACQGGRRRAGHWCADDKDLEPKAYDYHLGDDFGELDASLASARLSAQHTDLAGEFRIQVTLLLTARSVLRRSREPSRNIRRYLKSALGCLPCSFTHL